MRPAWHTPAAFITFSVALAFFVRVWFAHDAVFGGSFVRFAENDPWYHMRLVENLLHHFPRRITYDPYLLFGGGENVGVAPLFDLLVATVALIAGLGSPSPWLVEHIGAYLPAVLGALCVLPAYGLGKVLFSTRAGLLAAGLTAILPGQFLARSSLGFTDHHAAEVLLSACTLLFVARALDVKEPHSVAWRRTQSIAAGVFLGVYLLSWGGGALLIFVMASAAIAALLSDRDAQIAGRVAEMLTITFCVTAIVVAPFIVSWSIAANHLAVLAISGTSILLLAVIRSAIDRRGYSRWIMLLAVISMAAAVVFVGERAAPDSARLIYSYVWRLRANAGPRVAEALPLFSFPIVAPLMLFLEFGVSIYLALITAMVLLRRADAARWIVLVMFASALVLTVQQVRFSYYLAIPVAVIAGYACDRIMTWAGRRQEMAFLTLVVLVFVPNAQLARLYAESTTGPSDDWCEALTWLRANSPEPFGDANVFDADYSGMSEQRPHPLLAQGYGVTAWWDRGYWITRIAHRVPSANPTQAGASRVADVFVALDEDSGVAGLDRLRARYVIVDNMLPPRWIARRKLMVGVFADAIATAGRNADDYYQVYERHLPDGTVEPLLLFYPKYYQSFAVRLAAFDGRAVRPTTVPVAVFHSEPTRDGQRLILDELKSFDSPAAAADFISAAPGSRRLASASPFESCVALEAMSSMIAVHRSSPAGSVEIFERRQP